MTKFKAFADDNLNVAKMTISVFDRVENTLGKGENAGYQHFLVFPKCFPKPSSLEPLNVGIVRERVNTSVKRIDSGQPAQSAQADLGRTYLLLVNFLHIKTIDLLLHGSFGF